MRKERSLSKYQKPWSCPDALLEKLLRLRVLGAHGELDLASSAHQHGSLARAFVERLAVLRVTGLLVG